GPAEAGVTNPVPTQHPLMLQLELRGQGAYRRKAACAALSRTDWEIAAQEVALAGRVVRAFDAVLHRQGKLRLTGETIRLLEQAAEQVRKLVEQGRLRPADLILARPEVDDDGAQQDLARAAAETARVEFYRTLGLVEGAPEVRGTLEAPPAPWDAAELAPLALAWRPDLHARQAAVDEAKARVGLEVANRYGNPSGGTVYAANETSGHFIGPQVTLPRPVLNTPRAETQQRQPEVDRPP